MGLIKVSKQVDWYTKKHVDFRNNGSDASCPNQSLIFCLFLGAGFAHFSFGEFILKEMRGAMLIHPSFQWGWTLSTVNNFHVCHCIRLDTRELWHQRYHPFLDRTHCLHFPGFSLIRSSIGFVSHCFICVFTKLCLAIPKKSWIIFGVQKNHWRNFRWMRTSRLHRFRMLWQITSSFVTRFPRKIPVSGLIVKRCEGVGWMDGSHPSENPGNFQVLILEIIETKGEVS